MKIFTTLAIVSLAVSANAQDFSKVLSAISGDWNNDNKLDNAVLLKGEMENQADLTVTLSGLAEPIIVKDVAWVEPNLFGVSPTLETYVEPNTFQLKSMNGESGMSWEKEILVAYNDGKMVIAAYHREDSSEGDGDSSLKYDKECDINLLTGQGQVEEDGEKTKGNSEEALPLLSDFSSEYTPEFCRNFFTSSGV